MKPMLYAVMVLTSLAIGTALAADPVVGSWQLNAAKSSFRSGPAVKSQTRTYSQSGSKITLEIKSTGAGGKDITSHTTYQLDGKDYPVTGNPDYDSLSGKQVSENKAEFTLKRGGKAIGMTNRTVSKDGKTLTTETKYTTAGGEKSETTLIFDRQ